MSHMGSLEERLQAVLEAKGGTAVEDAKRIMLEGAESGDLRAALQYLAEHWRDPLRPVLMTLSCEAVGGSKDCNRRTTLTSRNINPC